MDQPGTFRWSSSACHYPACPSTGPAQGVHPLAGPGSRSAPSLVALAAGLALPSAASSVSTPVGADAPRCTMPCTSAAAGASLLHGHGTSLPDGAIEDSGGSVWIVRITGRTRGHHPPGDDRPVPRTRPIHAPLRTCLLGALRWPRRESRIHVHGKRDLQTRQRGESLRVDQPVRLVAIAAMVGAGSLLVPLMGTASATGSPKPAKVVARHAPAPRPPARSAVAPRPARWASPGPARPC